MKPSNPSPPPEPLVVVELERADALKAVVLLTPHHQLLDDLMADCPLCKLTDRLQTALSSIAGAGEGGLGICTTGDCNRPAVRKMWIEDAEPSAYFPYCNRCAISLMKGYG